MTVVVRGGMLAALLLCIASPAAAYDAALAARLDAVVQAQGDRFSGAILIARDGAILFDKAYGMADAAAGIPNRPSTSFHVGTLSMTYTAVTVLHLVETRKLALDNTADQFVPGGPFVTVRDLLAVAPDAPQAAADYELLARVAAAAAGTSFAQVEDAAAFASVWMSGTGLDDGTSSNESRIAKGYASDGAPLKPADWAVLTGAASAYTTTRDELHWLGRFFGDELVTADTRAAMASAPAGYGWHHGPRFGGEAYWTAGAAPGFASFVLAQPESGLTVIVLANRDGAPAEALSNQLVAALSAPNPPAGGP